MLVYIFEPLLLCLPFTMYPFLEQEKVQNPDIKIFYVSHANPDYCLVVASLHERLFVIPVPASSF